MRHSFCKKGLILTSNISDVNPPSLEQKPIIKVNIRPVTKDNSKNGRLKILAANKFVSNITIKLKNAKIIFFKFNPPIKQDTLNYIIYDVM